MKRDVLISALKRAAEEQGYAFHTGSEDRIPSRLSNFPTMWLTPVKLTSVRGRRECLSNYHTHIFLMMASTPDTRVEAESGLQILEKDAARIYHNLQQDPSIARIYGLKTSAVKSSFTKYAEITLSMEMDAELFYCL